MIRATVSLLAYLLLGLFAFAQERPSIKLIMTDDQGQGQVYPLDGLPDPPLVRNLDAIELNPDQIQLTKRYTKGALEFIEANHERP
jgi:hypothetical protein